MVDEYVVMDRDSVTRAILNLRSCVDALSTDENNRRTIVLLSSVLGNLECSRDTSGNFWNQLRDGKISLEEEFVAAPF